MIPTPLTDAPKLQALLAGGTSPTPLVLLDCGFDLADAGAGERAFAAGHLPGAAYAHLDRDLSGRKTGLNGRHPLPERQAWAATLGRLGVAPGTAVVAYDDHGGVYAARAWWLLRWAGHDAVAVLDGGRAAWQAAGGALVAGDTPRQPPQPAYPVSAAPAMPHIDTATLLQPWTRVTLVDARAPERYRGEVEPLDPVAGHIPGALNRFFRQNLGADGRFKPARQLREEYTALLGGGDDAPGRGMGREGRAVVHQCGSGVTACHNLLAMEAAGLRAGLLYPGSWSEWCADPARPVARGA
jgi:thiosulfate/3-mercaptopyruvate sulfurtransferase